MESLITNRTPMNMTYSTCFMCDPPHVSAVHFLIAFHSTLLVFPLPSSEGPAPVPVNDMLGSLTRSTSVPGLQALVGLAKLNKSNSLNALDDGGQHSSCDHVALQNRKDLRGVSSHDMSMKKVIGTGTFSTVRLCEHSPTKKTYAVKMISKQLVLQTKQLENVKREKDIMFSCAHPFIVNLNATYQDEFNVYMCLDFNEGGALDTHLSLRGRLDEQVARFYAASLVLVLEYLHNKGVVFRDLKPQNVMLDAQGFVKLCDFGLAKKLKPGKKTYTFCGTPAYQAPEILLNKGHNTAVDWWALGIVVFECLTGNTPFEGISRDDAMATQTAILDGHVEYPHFIAQDPKDLISNMLTPSYKKRLGHRGKGAMEVRSHAWFKGFDFDALLSRKLSVPMAWNIQAFGPGDSRTFPEVPRLFRLPARKDLFEMPPHHEVLFADF